MHPKIIIGIKRPVVAPTSLPYYARVVNTRPTSLIGAWPLWDAAGRTAVDLSKTHTVVDIYDNGGFEYAGAGGADIWRNTLEVYGDGALADEAVLVHEGGSAHACKITAGAGANTYVRCGNFSTGDTSVRVFPGLMLDLSFWTRGDGTNAGRFNIYDVTHGVWLRTTASTGVTGTAYAQVKWSFTVPDGCYEVQMAFMCPTANGGIAYFDDITLTCAWPNHGLYAPSGVTYGVEGIGDGNYAARFDGNNSHVLIGSKGFAQRWNGNIGSAIAWGRLDAAAWLDGSSYRYLFHPKSRQDATVYIVIGRSTTNNQLVWRRRVAGVTFERTYTFGAGPTTWFCMGFSWDIVSSPKRFAGYLYVPGILPFTKVFDEEPAVGTGDQNWDNATYTVDDLNNVLAAGSTTAQEWIGDEYLCACWAGEALFDTEMFWVMDYNMS